MENILKRQAKSIESIERIVAQDRLIQLIQAKEAIDSENEQEKISSQLEEMNQTLKSSLLGKSGDGLNSNMNRLIKKLEKITDDARKISGQEAKNISETSLGRRTYNTGQSRMANLKDSASDFFTVRGFLDKTGVVKRGSGGVLSEYLDKAEGKQKYINSRAKIDGGDKTSRKAYAKQFDAQQDIQFDISRNEKILKQYQDQGFTEEQIARTPEAKRRTELATNLAKVDPRVRPKGFDRKSGLVKEDPSVKPNGGDRKGGLVEEVQSSALQTGMSEAIKPNDAVSQGSDETLLEQNRMVAQQTDLLIQIEENTRPGSEEKLKPPTPAVENSSGGMLDMLGGKKLGGIAKAAGKGLLNAGKAFALPAAAAFAATNIADYGLGKLGIGKDEKGEDLKIDAAKDEENWSKMSTGQKVGSGVLRTIENIGGFVGLDNLAREASSARIAEESKYFEPAVSGTAQVRPNNQPQSGNIISKQSGDNEQAKLDVSNKPAGNTIVAPSTTVNNNQSKVSIKAPIRNQESSQSQYLRNRYVA